MVYSKMTFAKKEGRAQRTRRLCVTLTEDEYNWLHKIAFCDKKSLSETVMSFMRAAKSEKKYGQS